MDRANFTAILAASGLGLALLAWIVLAWRRTNFTFFQAFLSFGNAFFARVLWRTQVSGLLPVSYGEGAIIVCNHSSGVDPNVIQVCTDRVVHWLVAREYYEMPVLNWAFRATDTIPVNRAGVDTASTKMAIRLAQQGGLVGLFPEGRINTTPELLLPGRPGAALIALRARVKVIPCYVSGVPYDGTALGSLRMPAQARVMVGEPIDLSPYFGREGDKKVLEELTKRFLVEIAKLAGVADYQPKLAGRQWKNGELAEARSTEAVQGTAEVG
jgi:1-acyl-sn-glycerol-3-phosphate acyltransferase